MAFIWVHTTLHGWHKWLAHPHAPLLKRLLSLFKLPTSSNHFPFVCDSCQLGKSHRLHLNNSHLSSTKPFQLLYLDVWGPSPLFLLMEIVISFCLLMIALNPFRFTFYLINLKYFIPLWNFEKWFKLHLTAKYKAYKPTGVKSIEMFPNIFHLTVLSIVYHILICKSKMVRLTAKIAS